MNPFDSSLLGTTSDISGVVLNPSGQYNTGVVVAPGTPDVTSQSADGTINLAPVGVTAPASNIPWKTLLVIAGVALAAWVLLRKK